MKNSRILSVFFALVFAVTLLACGGGAKTEEPPAEEPVVETPAEEPATDSTAIEVDSVATPVDTVAVDTTAS